MKQGNISKEEFIRVGTTLYKLVNQPRLNGGYMRKRIVWNNETLRQDLSDLLHLMVRSPALLCNYLLHQQ